MTINNDNLGKYNLKKMLRNPALIHQIQDALLKLEIGKELSGVNMLTMAIVSYRDNALVPLIKILFAETDRAKVISIIGEPTMQDIIEYMEGEEPEPNDIPENLYISPSLSAKLNEEEPKTI